MSRDLGHAPFVFELPLGFPQTKRYTKFEVSISSSFEDMFDCMPKIEGSCDLGHAPFGENYWRDHSAFPRGSCILNLKSVVSISFEDMFNCIPKIVGVM